MYQIKFYWSLGECGTAASAVISNLEDSLLATASAVTVSANYTYYVIIM